MIATLTLPSYHHPPKPANGLGDEEKIWASIAIIKMLGRAFHHNRIAL